MGELKPKKQVRRRVSKSANSPEPMGVSSSGENDPTCGHGGCGRMCSVRYVGPTSPMRDQHIVHAARGVTHVWSAAIITGFAIVLTGAIAFNAAQASTEKKSEQTQQQVKQDVGRDLRKLTVRLEAMENLLKKVADQCLSPETASGDTSTP